MINNKNAQVWIETVLYTLIGLALIAAVLVFVTPKITQLQDKLIVDQSIAAMKVIDLKIQNIISQGSGNVGEIQDFTLKRGSLNINTLNDSIVLKIDGLKTAYSEPNVVIFNGRIKLITYPIQNTYSVNLSVSYSINLTYAGADGDKVLIPSSKPYIFTIENVNSSYLDINEVSGNK